MSIASAFVKKMQQFEVNKPKAPEIRIGRDKASVQADGDLYLGGMGFLKPKDALHFAYWIISVFSEDDIAACTCRCHDGEFKRGMAGHPDNDMGM